VKRSFEYGPNEVFFEAESTLLATGYKPEGRLARELEGKLVIYNPGDSMQPGNVKEAIWGLP
jgi:2,4-dienoyl-CoA reductase (NADPH2)